MDFESAVQYLKTFSPYEDKGGSIYDDKKFNLERVKKFYKRLRINYQKLKYVHVAGSKGKGSTCFFIANYLKKKGYKVGMFTSPYLVDITESFWVDGKNITKEKFVSYVEFIKKMFDKEGNKYHVTYFEILTGLIFQYFIEKKIDYAVIEVGLGGRLDATNVVNPKITVLTSMEKEHQYILGKTLEKILDEKLGIIKKGVPLIIGKNSKYVMNLVKEKVGNKTKIVFINDMDGGENLIFNELKIPDVQKENAKLAYVVLKFLLKKCNISDFCSFVEREKFLGRFDFRIVNGKRVVFDIAHTKNSISGLIKYLLKKFPNSKFVFLFSLMKDKDVKAILGEILPVSKKIVFTESNKDRGFLARDLVKIAHKLNPSADIEDDMDARKSYKNLLKNLNSDEVLVVTGSHFLVGNILKD